MGLYAESGRPATWTSCHRRRAQIGPRPTIGAAKPEGPWLSPLEQRPHSAPLSLCRRNAGISMIPPMPLDFHGLRKDSSILARDLRSLARPLVGECGWVSSSKRSDEGGTKWVVMTDQKPITVQSCQGDALPDCPLRTKGSPLRPPPTPRARWHPPGTKRCTA